MRSSINCSNKAVVILVAALFLLTGCASARTGAEYELPGRSEKPLIVAILPIENLSGKPVPLKDVRQMMTGVVKHQGLSVLDDAVLDAFLAKHRIRYVGGIDSPTAQALRQETGADAVLITTVELFTPDPAQSAVLKVSLFCRLVSTDEKPVILWMESVGLSGDESPGLLELGVIREPKKLLQKAAKALSNSLYALRSGNGYNTSSRSFPSQVSYRSSLVGLNFRECTVSFALRSASGENQDGHLRLYAYLSTVNGRKVTVDYAVTGGTARGDGRDFTLKPGTLTFNPGETVKSIDVDIVRKTQYDDDKTIEVGLTRPINAVLGDVRVHTYTVSNTAPMPSVSFTSPVQSAKEDAGTAVITAKLSAVSVKDVIVPLTASGTAISQTNYRLLTPGPLVIKAGAASADIQIALIASKMNEEDKTVVLTMGPLTNAGPGQNPVHTLTIADTDPAPAIAFAVKGSGGKAGSPARLDVSLSAKSGKQVTVDYAVIGGTARGDGRDFTLKPGTLTFNPGETVKTIEVEIKQGTMYDEDRTIEVGLAKPVNAVLGDVRVHTHAVSNTAPMPVVAFSASAQEVQDDVGTIFVKVQLSAISAKDVTVPFTVEGTARDLANYRLLTPSPLIIKAGEASANIGIVIISNGVQENDKTLRFTMGAPFYAARGARTTHSITIVDTDNPRTVTVIPFFNDSGRKNAGDIVMLHFVTHLVQSGKFSVIEPGVVREKFLNMRIIMREGIASPETDLLTHSLNADLVLTGKVLDYQDPIDGADIPKVDILAAVIERKSKKIIWAAKSFKQGDDSIVIFDVGRVYIANQLAKELGSIVDNLLLQ